MLSIFKLMIKLALFSLAVLLAGEWIRWDGRTLGQHLQRQIASMNGHMNATGAADYMRGMARTVTDDARSGFDKMTKHRGRKASPVHVSANANAEPSPDETTDRTETQAAAPRPAPAAKESLPSSERQKLRALIRELNSSDAR